MTAWLMISARVLLGLNYPNLSLPVVLVRLFAIAVPVAYLAVFVFHAPIDGVWAGIVAGNVGAAALAAFLVRRIVWQQDPTARPARRMAEEPTGVEAA